MRVKLGEVCEIYTGTGFPAQYQGRKEGKYPFYKVGDISKNVQNGYQYLKYCDNYIDDKDLIDIKGSIIPRDAVVFAKIGEAVKLNRRAITACECLVDNNAMGIKPKDEKLDVMYFFYYMCNLHLENYAESTTVPSVKKSVIEKMEIPLPNIREQKNIVKVLNNVAKLINLRKQQLSKLDELIKARFVELTESTNTVLTRMGDIATYINGYAFKPAQWEDSGHPIIRIQNLNNENAPYNYYSGKLPDKYLVHNGDVLVSWATHLEAYIWKGKEAWLNQHIFKVVFDKIEVDKTYFVYACEETLRQAFRNAHGFKPTMEHIKKADFDAAIVRLPDSQTQKKFAAFVEQTDKSKLAVQKSLEELETLKKSLMQQYFG